MSENRLLFVPKDPGWQSAVDDAGRAVAYLASIAPNPVEISISFTERMIFHMGMGNWSGVRCPACKADLEEWLFVQLKVLHLGQLLISSADLLQTTPCCASNLSLNDLDYEWPAAFGRFCLGARNPGLVTTKEQDDEIAARLGNPVRTIWERL